MIYRQKFASGDKVTSVGKEYLCNACLSEDPAAVSDSRISTTTSDDDDDDDDDGGGGTGDEAGKKKTKTVYNSVSAPATPAKKDLSATSRSPRIMTDVDSSLDMSTRSLLEVHASDGTLPVLSVLSYVLSLRLAMAPLSQCSGVPLSLSVLAAIFQVNLG